MNEPRLSIVMATYNAGDAVGRTIASIRSQLAFDAADVEVLLMDGGSTDSTVEIARTSGIFRVIVSHRDAGVYDAMNVGAERAEGRWIQFLNAGDTFADETSLTKILTALTVAEDAGRKWVVGGARNGSAGGAIIRNIPHDWFRHLLGLQPHCHQASFFDRQGLIGVGAHSLEFGTAGDFDFVMRFGFAAGTPAHLHATVIDYEGGGMSDVGPRETARRLGKVRRARFHLRGALAGFDRGLAWTLGIVNLLRIRLGRVRHSIRRARPPYSAIKQ